MMEGNRSAAARKGTLAGVADTRPPPVAALISLQLFTFSAVVLSAHAYRTPVGPGVLALDVVVAAAAAVLPLATPLRRWSHVAIMAALLAAAVLTVRMVVAGSMTPSLVQAALVAGLGLMGGGVRRSLDRLSDHAFGAPSPGPASLVSLRAWHARLADEFARARRSERPLGVVAFRFSPHDVSGRDEGHPADRTDREPWSLASVASSIGVHLRHADVVTCDAPEGTVWILCVGARTDELAGFVERIQEKVWIPDHLRSCSATAAFPTDALSPESLVDAVKAKLDDLDATNAGRAWPEADVPMHARDVSERSAADGMRGAGA